jgi:hypothetical protein
MAYRPRFYSACFLLCSENRKRLSLLWQSQVRWAGFLQNYSSGTSLKFIALEPERYANTASLIRIAESLPVSDRCSLSLANAQFRGFLAPILYNTLRIKNEGTQDEVLLAFAHKYGQYVHKLAFHCHLHRGSIEENEEESGEDDDEEKKDDADPGPNESAEETKPDGDASANEQSTPPPSELSQCLRDFLSGSLLPKMTSLQVVFVPEGNFEDGGWDSEDSMYTIGLHQSRDSSNLHI